MIKTIMEGSQPEILSFPVEKEYARCVAALNDAGIIRFLSGSENLGIIGFDGREYPLPDHEPVAELFEANRDLVQLKISQGFDRMELVPMAVPVNEVIYLLGNVISRHKTEGRIFLPGKSEKDAGIPALADTAKPVWIKNLLKQALDSEEILYFPSEFSKDHGGQTKAQVTVNRNICAFPGWSVGLVESAAISPGKGSSINGRSIPENLSPEEYLKLLEEQPFFGETGITIEDFIIRFLTRLTGRNEISFDEMDDNSVWLIGNYMPGARHLKSDLVPAGCWQRDRGRLLLDTAKPGKKMSSGIRGLATTVRLHSKTAYL